MSRGMKKLLLLALVVTGAGSFCWNQAAAAKQPRPASVTCTVDILFEFKAQDGTVLRSELYQQNFVLTEGVTFVDDFSTPTRAKVFTATLTTVRGEALVAINWFSDVSVFDAAELNTTLSLEKGQRRGKALGDHTFSSTPGHATTHYSLVGVRN